MRRGGCPVLWFSIVGILGCAGCEERQDPSHSSEFNAATLVGKSANDGDGAGTTIGATLRPLVYHFEVLAVDPGGGAAEAGLQRGDRILRVDDNPVSEIGHRAALERLAGPAGTSVLIELKPRGAKLSQRVRIRRIPH